MRKKNIAYNYYYAANGEEVMEHLASKTCNIIFLDYLMPKMDGFACARKIRELYPEVKLICLSAYTTEKTVKEAFKSGMHAFIGKIENPEVIIEAIEKVLKGERFISKKVKEEMLEDSISREQHIPNGYPEATELEIEVVELLAQGLTIAEISEKLNIAESTVKSRQQSAFKKFDVNKSSKLVDVFRKLGIIK